jgi:hypothetical protein
MNWRTPLVCLVIQYSCCSLFFLRLSQRQKICGAIPSSTPDRSLSAAQNATRGSRRTGICYVTSKPSTRPNIPRCARTKTQQFSPNKFGKDSRNPIVATFVKRLTAILRNSETTPAGQTNTTAHTAGLD